MKTRFAIGLCMIAFLLTILPENLTLVGANPMMSAVAVSLPQGGFFPTAPFFTNSSGVLPPQGSSHPLASAQQACLQGGGGWNWRQGHVAMCFKPGHAICPAGHPWMRQITQRYTICLSTSIPAQSLPRMGGY